MSSRTTHTTVTFEHPFSLKGLDGPQAPGTFKVQTDDELMEGVSFPAYRRTLLRLIGPDLSNRLPLRPPQMIAADQRRAGRRTIAAGSSGIRLPQG
jgi:hypothetical protein